MAHDLFLNTHHQEIVKIYGISRWLTLLMIQNLFIGHELIHLYQWVEPYMFYRKKMADTIEVNIFVCSIYECVAGIMFFFACACVHMSGCVRMCLSL